MTKEDLPILPISKIKPHQTVSTKTMTLLKTELTVSLTPALVYGAVGDTLTLTCNITGDGIQLVRQSNVHRMLH